MALCIECRTNKTFERGAKRCSDCQAAYDATAPRTDATDTPTSRDAAADTISPGSLLMIGIVGQVVGGLVIAATRDTQGDGGLLIGVLITWAGGLALLVALIAFGVKIGIESATSTRQAP